jgi:hypothetical protein
MVDYSESSTKSSRIIVERTVRLWGGHHHDTDWDQMQQLEIHNDDIRQVTTNVRQKMCGYLKELSRWIRQCLKYVQWSSSRSWRSSPPPVMVTVPTTAPPYSDEWPTALFFDVPFLFRQRNARCMYYTTIDVVFLDDLDTKVFGVARKAATR